MPKPAPQLEHKTIWTTVIATLVGIAVAALNGLQAHSDLLGALPATYQTLILALVPPLVTLLAGYSAPHTERTDIAAGDFDAEAAAYHAGDV
jgi:hypothetical protein